MLAEYAARLRRGVVAVAILSSSIGLVTSVAAISRPDAAAPSARRLAGPHLEVIPHWVHPHDEAQVNSRNLYPGRIATLQRRLAPDGTWHNVVTKRTGSTGQVIFTVNAPWAKNSTAWYRVQMAAFKDANGSHPALLTNTDFLKNNATRVSGTIAVPEGKTAGGITVSLFRKTASGWRREHPESIHGDVDLVTGSGGGYVIENVRPGIYKMQFQTLPSTDLVSAWLGDTLLSTDSRTIQFSGGSVANVNASLITGHESLSVNTSPTRSQSYQRDICAWLAGETLAPLSCTDTFDSGPVVVQALVPGKYKVVAHVVAAPWWANTWYSSSTTRSGGALVEVIQGSPPPQVTITMAASAS